ncbi:MAG: peptidylprolyl isomerase [Proteobacteria bacterium]|nr:peptidylprolyl isomerase [Pseudomonadota bacterium]
MGALLMGVVRRRFVAAILVMAASGALLSAAAGRGTCATEPPPALDTVAAVNGDPLPRTILDRAFLRIAKHYVRFGPGLPIARMWSYRLDALSQAVDEQLVDDEARAHEVSVSADEVEAALDEMVNQYLVQLGGQGDDLETRLAQACAALGGPSQPTMSEPHFRAWLRDWLRPRYADEVTAALTMKQLKAEVIPLPTVTEDDLRAHFATITLRTIAIRHTSAERWEEAAREARERAEAVLRQIRAGADFAALAATASDDERYRATGGLEEAVLLSSLNPDRQTAVASLQVGEVSELIRTDRGYEILRLEERGHSLPPDYEESKPQLRARLEGERQQQAWQAHVRALHDDAAITVTDPELQAYACLREGREEEALALLETASQDAERLGPAGAASVFFQLGARYSVQHRWAEAAQAYASCDHYVSQVLNLFPDARVAALFGLGHTHENLGLQLREQQQFEEGEAASAKAVEYYQEVGRQTDSHSHHDRLRLAYMRLGRPDLAEQEEAWLERHYRVREAQRTAIRDGRAQAGEIAGESEPYASDAPVDRSSGGSRDGRP